MRARLDLRSILLLTLVGAGCGGELDGGVSVTRTEEGLSGCHGQASASVPSSGEYFLTTFGASASDNGQMSCGDFTKDGSWYYAASRQRYGCGSRIRVEANGHCVVAQTDDYGPDVCVENAAGGPILDASPLVAKALFGTGSAGWSDHLRVHVTAVASSTALGPCAGGAGPTNSPPPQHGAGDCHSSTLDKDVATGVCVQSASDGNWYKCEGGAWAAGHSGCTTSYAWCHSATLGAWEPPRTCVQSRSDSAWYQCGASGWEAPVHDGAGPVGTCSSEHAL